MRIRRAIWHFMRRRKKISPIRMVALGFLALILLGTLLLSLPAATRAPGSAPFFTALFTAVSATSVTGLVLHDTLTYWSVFGQVVILALFQVGGLGIMTVVAILSFLLHRTIGLRERLLMVHSLNLNDLTGVVRMVRHVLFVTLVMEAVGTVILSFRFVGEFGFWGGLYRSVFHAMSAFCNAGFDLMGPGRSLTGYTNDPLVCLTLLVLMILGCIGFFVWEDIYRNIRLRRQGIRNKLHLHTKLVLMITGLLAFGGAAVFLLSEYENPATIGTLPLGGKVMASLFQSVTCSTAGYVTLDQTALTAPSKLVSTILMFVGGSPGSMAGGIKTITLGVLVLSAVSLMRGRTQVVAFGRGISEKQVFASLSIVMVAFLSVFISLGAMAILEPDRPFFPLVYEAVAAMSTGGVSMGITGTLTVGSQMILMLLMYFGRVGMLTLGIAILLRRSGHSRMKFPETKLIIG